MKKVPSPLRRSCEQKNGRHLFQPFLHRYHPLNLHTCHHTIPRAATQAHCNHLMIRLLSTTKLSQSTPIIELSANTLLSSQLVSLPREFNKILLKNLLIYSMRYKNRHITLSLQTIMMNCAGLYFTRQDILEQLSTLLQYFDNQVHSTLTHPLRTMNEEDANIFFKGTLQIYVEFWNSRKPLVEYIPYVPKPQDTLEVQINSHIKEIWSLLSYIKSAIYFPCVNNLHSFKILDKLNRDLTNILEQYFYTNIWSDWKDISALYPQCSPPFRIENARAYMCTICDIEHFITRKEKHEYLVRAVSAIAVLIRQISFYPCLYSASTSDLYSTTHMQYSAIRNLKKVYKITMCRLRAFDMEPRIKLNIVPGPLKHFQRSEVFLALCNQLSVHTERLLSKIVNSDVNEIWMEKYEQTLQVYSRLSKCLQKFVAYVHPAKCGQCK